MTCRMKCCGSVLPSHNNLRPKLPEEKYQAKRRKHFTRFERSDLKKKGAPSQQGMALLESDGLDRGPHSIHLRGHRKLGRHKTIINIAVPILRAVISLPSIKVVHLGQIRLCYGRGADGLRIRPLGKRIQIWISNPDVIQVLNIEPRIRDEVSRQEIIAYLRAAGEENNLPLYFE
jgi:hypothetical protein